MLSNHCREQLVDDSIYFMFFLNVYQWHTGVVRSQAHMIIINFKNVSLVTKEITRERERVIGKYGRSSRESCCPLTPNKLS